LPQARTLAAALLFCAMLPAAASSASSATVLPAANRSASSATLHTSFIPERLGAPTAVSFGFQIAASGRVPPPLSGVDVAYPSNLGFATSGLGLAPCSPGDLEEFGPDVCPADSIMGHGDALVEIPIGPEVVRERVELELFAGPSPDGYLHILVYAMGTFPVEAHAVLSGVLRNGRLDIVVPPIPSLPAGPYVVVTQMQLTLGGNLTYYERVNGRRVAYHPAGVGLPRTCPRGGFAFAARFAFIDGSRSAARTSVPCPRRR
jgi:hypothetical protein